MQGQRSIALRADVGAIPLKELDIKYLKPYLGIELRGI
jgi:hypothetical protein